MDISSREQNAIKVLAFTGKLDTNTVAEAEAQIDTHLVTGTRSLIINFEQLDYISSAGLRLLLVTAKRLKKVGGAMRVCGLNPTVQEVFDISGFGTILSVVDSEQDALEALV